jgi:serine/threonine-protein kinase
MTGQTIGHYRVLDKLGAGGMGVVYRGEDIRLRRKVALKFLADRLFQDQQVLERFRCEARTASALNHPHICTIHDIGEHEGQPYIVMELLEGQTLGHRIGGRPLETGQLLEWGIQIADALGAAHEKGIVHRDIKPANILFTTSGDVKVADFGIAKSAGAAATMTGQILGTMAYLSADRLAGRPATVADDLYAVGVVGYEALSGHKPFPQENPAALARAIAEDTPPPLTLLRPDVEPGLAATIDRAMAREPQWRFPNAEAMRAALSGAPQLNSVRPPTRVLAAPLPPPTTMAVATPVPPSRTRKLLVLAAVLAAIALAAVLVLFESGSQPSGPEPASTSTSVPPPTTSVTPPPPTAPPPAQIDQGPPVKKKGNGNGRKPKGERGGD